LCLHYRPETFLALHPCDLAHASRQNIQCRGFNYNSTNQKKLSYNGAKTAVHKHSFKSSAINGRAKEGMKKRNCERADGERRKEMNI